MTFDELKLIFENEFQIFRLADIARELDVTPQVVNSWKSRNQVPYSYVKVLKEKIGEQDNDINMKLLIKSSFINSFLKFVKNNSPIILYYFRKSRFIILLPLFFSLLALGLGKLYLEPIYKSELKYLPIEDNNQNKISINSLAGRFGLPQIGSDNEGIDLLSWRMIPILLNSQYLSEKILNRKFLSNKYQQKLKLVNILAGVADTSAIISEIKKRLALKKLRSSITHSSARNSSLKTVSVNMFEAKLSTDILVAYIEELNILFVEYFKEKNSSKKEFLQARLADIQKQLTKSENKLKIFREKNRNIFKSPELQLDQERLLRDTEVLSEVYINLRSEYEILLVNEKANINIFKIIDSPEIPISRVSPNNTKNMIYTFLISMVAIMLILTGMFYWNDNIREINNTYTVFMKSFKNN